MRPRAPSVWLAVILALLVALILATTAQAAPGDAKHNPPTVTPTAGTTVTDPSGSPPESTRSGVPSASLSPSPGPNAESPGSRSVDVPIEGVVAIGLLGAVTVAAALRERRRRAAVEAFRAAEASTEEVPRGEGREEGWEDDLADDETVATIDYESPVDQPDPDA